MSRNSRTDTHAVQNLQFLSENITLYFKNTYKITRKLERAVFEPDYPSLNQLKTLGDHILKKRMDLWLEQKEVAEIIGVNKCTIANWEKNRNAPRIRQLPKIIDFLGYQPCDEGYRTLGERIIKERQRMGLSQKQLAIQIGIDPCTIRSWEKGKHKPNKYSLQILTKFFTNGRSVQTVRRVSPNRFETLNLRIDSPTNGFVSICEQTINDREIKTYDDDSIATVPQQ